MHYKNYFYLTISTFILGILLIALQKNWIILRFPSYQSLDNNQVNHAYHKKRITLFGWKNDNWCSEQNEILWSQDPAENIINLMQNWLAWLDDEKLTHHKITLQSTILTANRQTAFLSFDQSLFNKDANTYQKLMLIESLLKTFRANQITIPQIQFLVRHQLAKDPHLDLSNPWPINGFLTN